MHFRTTMMSRKSCFWTFIFLALTFSWWQEPSSFGDELVKDNILNEVGQFSCLSPKEAELYRLVNEYRESNGLPPVPNARSLNKVARIHAVDLFENDPAEGTDDRGFPCSLHSWSNKGSWKPVCYTNDHAYADAMWEKPREITNFTYSGDGYENAYYTSEDEVSPEKVLAAWKASPSHNALLIETGMWQGSNIQAIGIGVYKHYAVIWVGLLIDPLGSMQVCSSSPK